MNDDRKAIEQALQAPAMELKAKGTAADPEAEAAPEAQTAEPEQVTEPAADPQLKKKPEKEKKDESKPSKSAGKKQSAAALKEIAKIRRNKIIGITAAVLAVMVFIFLIARDGGNKVRVVINKRRTPIKSIVLIRSRVYNRKSAINPAFFTIPQACCRLR